MSDRSKENTKTPKQLGCLELRVNQNADPGQKILYLWRDGELYAVLHTDTAGNTRKIWLPCEREGGTVYDCVIENGGTEKITVYPHIVNIHYIET